MIQTLISVGNHYLDKVTNDSEGTCVYRICYAEHSHFSTDCLEDAISEFDLRIKKYINELEKK